MNCLMDNDVILKLAATQLLDEWKTKAIKDGKIRIGASAKYFFRKKKDLPKKFGEAAVKLSVNFAEKIETVSDVDNPADYEGLIGIPGIDAGEAILFSAAIRLPDFVIVSGDKVALKALKGSSDFDVLKKKLKGRIIAFEQVILALIRKGNFESIRERVVAAQKIDTVLEVVFGMGLETTEAKAIEALNYYIDGLRKATGDLLISEKELDQLLS